MADIKQFNVNNADRDIASKVYQTSGDSELYGISQKGISDIISALSLTNLKKQISPEEPVIFQSKSEARSFVPVYFRKAGLIISYILQLDENSDVQNISEEYLSDDISNWSDDSNWTNVLTTIEVDTNSYVYQLISSDNIVLFAIDFDGKPYFPNHQLFESKNYEISNEPVLEATVDAEGRVFSYRDMSGVLHENKIEVDKLIINNKIDYLGSSFINDIEKSLKDDNFISKYGDWTDDMFINVPIPRGCVKININSTSLPTTKTANISAILEFWDKDGNYFSKPIILNAQGTSSMSYSKKNFSIDITDGSKIKFGSWVVQDSFHLKAYYIDIFRGQNNVAYKLMEEVYQTRLVSQQRPWDYIYNENISLTNSNGSVVKDFPTGALAHPDGFPVELYHNGEFYGLYAWNLKKHRDNYHADKNDFRQIILDGELGVGELFCDNADNIDWAGFEIRNPKELKNTAGSVYTEGDVLSSTDSNTLITKNAIRRLSEFYNTVESSESPKEKFSEYFLVDFLIDYFIVSNILYHSDGFRKNWIWCTWDGLLWTPTLYDADSIFGCYWTGAYVSASSIGVVLGTNTNIPTKLLYKYYKEEIKARYKELRDLKVIDTKNIIQLLKDWVDCFGYENYKKELEKWPNTPSYSSSGFYNSIARTELWTQKNIEKFDEIWEYNR